MSDPQLTGMGVSSLEHEQFSQGTEDSNLLELS